MTDQERRELIVAALRSMPKDYRPLEEIESLAAQAADEIERLAKTVEYMTIAREGWKCHAEQVERERDALLNPNREQWGFG